jgi:hypothetical protein
LMLNGHFATLRGKSPEKVAPDDLKNVLAAWKRFDSEKARYDKLTKQEPEK